MRKWITFVLCVFLFPLYSQQYKLVVGSMFKNEAPWLKEWIEYYKILGVEHFYLYNNESSDNYQEVLDPYIQAGIVDLISWDSTSSHIGKQDTGNWAPYTPYQFGAFDDCIKRTNGVAQFVGFFDIDEFLVPAGGKQSLDNLLNNTSMKIGTLRFYLTYFGNSFISEMPEDSLIIDELVLRSSLDKNYNSWTKCIHRPEAVLAAGQHFSTLKKGYDSQFVDRNTCRINHYWMKDLKTFAKKRPNSDLDAIEDEFNYFYDDTILQFVPTLKQAMGLN